MTPQDLPPIELLEDILLPLKWTIDRIYWWGFKDGVGVGVGVGVMQYLCHA